MTIAACPPSTPVTPGVVVFNLAEFTGIYPEFTGVGSAAAQNQFNIATLFLRNCCSSAVFDPNIRQSLLYMLTAHNIFLFVPCAANTSQPPGIVGRINNAAEGSVSVAAEMPGVTLNAAFFMQTKYGAQFWAATALYRTMISVPSPFTGCAPGALGSFGGPPRCNW